MLELDKKLEFHKTKLFELTFCISKQFQVLEVAEPEYLLQLSYNMVNPAGQDPLRTKQQKKHGCTVICHLHCDLSCFTSSLNIYDPSFPSRIYSCDK